MEGPEILRPFGCPSGFFMASLSDFAFVRFLSRDLWSVERSPSLIFCPSRELKDQHHEERRLGPKRPSTVSTYTRTAVVKSVISNA